MVKLLQLLLDLGLPVYSKVLGLLVYSKFWRVVLLLCADNFKCPGRKRTGAIMTLLLAVKRGKGKVASSAIKMLSSLGDLT